MYHTDVIEGTVSIRLARYINNIVGLYLSSDFDTIPIFVNRAYKEIENRKKMLENNGTETPPYYNFVLEYLGLMAEFSNSLKSIPEYLKSRIPEKLLQGKVSIEDI